MNNSNLNEEHEVLELAKIYSEAMQLVLKGEVEAAYKSLIQLPQPETEQGLEFMTFVRIIKLYIRALKLMKEEGDKKEIKGLLTQVIQEASDFKLSDRFSDSVKADFTTVLTQLRQTANGILIIVTSGVNGLRELTPDQQKQLDKAGLNQVIYQSNLQMDAIKESEEAMTAFWTGNENEFANKISRAKTLWERAGEENPVIRDLISSSWLLIELRILSEQQLQRLSQFDFENVPSTASDSNQKVTQLKRTYSNSKVSGLIYWAPQVGDLYQTLSIAFTDLATLIKEVLGGPVKGKHLEKLKELDGVFRNIRRNVTSLQGSESIMEESRKNLLDKSSKGLHIISNLRIGLRPTRQAVLSISGIAAAVGFLCVVAITFLIGNLVGMNLEPKLVLSIGVFFGLVVGFGYGAIRFRGFLLDLIRGGESSTKGETDGNA